MKKACFLIIVFLAPLVVDAQSFYKRRRDRSFVASFGTGLGTYFGDLKDPGDYIDTKLNLEFGLEYKFASRFGAKAMLTLFRLEGNDDESKDLESGRIQRNLWFRSDNMELTVLGTVQLYEDKQRYYQRRNFNIYGFAGFGILWYSPRATIPETGWDGSPLPDAGKWTALRQYKTEQADYGAFSFVIPVGLGIRYKINPWFNIALDGGYRFTFTDYLDDVSSTYPGISSFSDDPVAAALSDRRHELDLNARPEGSIRGNPDKNDGYFLWNVKVEYYLPSFFGVGTGAHRRNAGRHR